MQTAYCHDQDTLESERRDTRNRCTGKHINWDCPGKPGGMATQYQMQLCKPPALNKEEKELDTFYPAKGNKVNLWYPRRCFFSMLSLFYFRDHGLAEVSLNLGFYAISHTSPFFPTPKKKKKDVTVLNQVFSSHRGFEECDIHGRKRTTFEFTKHFNKP